MKKTQIKVSYLAYQGSGYSSLPDVQLGNANPSLGFDSL